MGRVALVTGANQGLGLALVRRLLDVLDGGDEVYLTARDPARGREAVEQLAASGRRRPRLQQLDVTDSQGVTAALDQASSHSGGLDIVIHNAAARITPGRPQAEQVRTFVETNNLGTTRILRELRDRLRPGARVIVVASSFGTLQHLPRALHAPFLGPHATLDALDEAMTRYLTEVEQGLAAARGWPDWINVPSKVGQVAAMRAFARGAPSGTLVNAACPGLVDTGASRPWFSDMSAAATPDEAAVDVVWLATLPHGADAPHGELVQHRKILPFTPGDP